MIPGEPQPESRFTVPRLDCPNPKYWHSTDGDSTEIEVSELVGAFVRALQPELVVESGAAWGQTSAEIGIALRANGHGRLVTTEIQPDRVAFTEYLCRELPVEVVEGSSLDYVPDGPVGFAWLDSYEDLRVAEAVHYHRWMGPGSVIGIHDTGPQHQPLRAHIEALVGEGWLNPLWLPTPRGVVFLEVTK